MACYRCSVFNQNTLSFLKCLLSFMTFFTFAISITPDYTVSMSLDFIAKLKQKEREKDDKRNRAPFLACLELTTKIRERNIQASSTGNFPGHIAQIGRLRTCVGPINLCKTGTITPLNGTMWSQTWWTIE